jgi:hypothetical protein
MLYKIYPQKEKDNLMHIALLSGSKIMLGNSSGLLSNFDTALSTAVNYNLPISSEIEFIKYDKKNKLIFCSRGVLKESHQRFLEEFNYSKGIARDVYGNIIIASYGSAYIINDKFGEHKHRLPLQQNPLYKKFWRTYVGNKVDSVLVIRNIRSINVLAAYNQSKFWIAFEDDLYEYHYDGTISILRKPNGDPIIARTLVENENGQLIAGTTTDGVFIINNSKVIKHFTTAQGLKSNTIKNCLSYNGKFWVLTDESIDVIDSKSYKVAGLLDELGLENLQINDFTISGNKFYLATTNGLVVNRQENIFNQHAIRFSFLKASANGVPFLKNANLLYSENNILFQMEALHYKSPTSLMYNYKLSGVDSVWRRAYYFINSIPYNRLVPGKYTFQIQAVDADGKYKSKMMRFDFVIASPFWKRWWFILLSICLFVTIAYYGMRWWTKRLLTRETLREQLFKSQLVALRSQMNPHFLYNVLNTVHGLVYDNKKIEAGNLLGNFSDLMRKTLESSDKQLQTLKDETENLKLYLELEKARFDDNDFSFDIHTNLTEDLASVFIPSLLLQPLAENAVKHGLMHKQGHKQLTISFDAANNGMLVTIDDNGIGRKQSMAINARNKNKPQSFATKALNERVTLFNKLYRVPISYTVTDKVDSNEYPSGTRVELLIPYYHLT